MSIPWKKLFKRAPGLLTGLGMMLSGIALVIAARGWVTGLNQSVSEMTRQAQTARQALSGLQVAKTEREAFADSIQKLEVFQTAARVDRANRATQIEALARGHGIALIKPIQLATGAPDPSALTAIPLVLDMQLPHEEPLLRFLNALANTTGLMIDFEQCHVERLVEASPGKRLAATCRGQLIEFPGAAQP